MSNIAAFDPDANEPTIQNLEQAWIDCIDAIAGGDFSVSPEGDHPVSQALRRLIEARVESVSKALDSAVGQAIVANESAIASGRMIAAAREVDERSQTMAAAIEELSSSIEGISQASGGAEEAADAVTASLSNGKEAVGSAVTVVERVRTDLVSAADKAEDLSAASEKIGDIVLTIEDIASRTNLLALNATIEAARAGQAGKGFAVVASEVKNLSQQTAQATKDIRDRIEALRSEISNIVGSLKTAWKTSETGSEAMRHVNEGMGEIEGRVSIVEQRMAEISKILAEQSAAANEVAEGVTTITDMSKRTVSEVENTADSIDRSLSIVGNQMTKFADYDVPGKVVRLAKADHVIWKKRLSNMLVGRESLRPDELADHHSCRLGKWYYSDLADDFRSHPAFARLEDPHARVHQHGIEAARRYQAGDIEGALESIELMEDASKDVLDLLNELQGESG